MMTKEGAEYCASQLMRSLTFDQPDGDDIIVRIIKTAVSTEYARRNPGFKFRRTARTKAHYWCCYAGPSVPIYDFMNGTVQLTTAENCYVLSGTRHEKYTISQSNLMKLFQVPGRGCITSDILDSFAQGQWFKVLPVQAEVDNLELTMSAVWAMSIPSELEFTVRLNEFETKMGNARGVEHAAGDLILVGDDGGSPDFSRLGLVNGGVFADCYSKRNFASYLPYVQTGSFKMPGALLVKRA